jgi:hypothetical protein
MSKVGYELVFAAVAFLASVDTSFAAEVTPAAGAVHKIGAVTWHPLKFIGQEITLSGYLLAREKGYAFFSDEPKGRVSAHDLPVSGPGLEALQFQKKYKIQGKFLDSGLTVSNGSTYHLELTAAPTLLNAKP